MATDPQKPAPRPLIFDIRASHPGLARRADTGSPRACSRLFCLECMGGSGSAVKACASTVCSQWELRLGRGREQRPDGVYPELPPPKAGPAGGAEALAAYRARAAAGADDDDDEDATPDEEENEE